MTALDVLVSLELVCQHVQSVTIHSQTQLAVIVKLTVSTVVSEILIATSAMTTTVPSVLTLTLAHVLRVILLLHQTEVLVSVVLPIGRETSTSVLITRSLAVRTIVPHAPTVLSFMSTVLLVNPEHMYNLQYSVRSSQHALMLVLQDTCRTGPHLPVMDS